MKLMIKTVFVVVLLTCGMGHTAYLDAIGGVGGNTVRADNANPDTWWTATTAPDGLWGLRTGYATEATVYESSGTDSGVEDAVPVITTISGLTPGQTYQIQAVYWSSNTQNWSIRAGFDVATMNLYDRTGDSATPGTASGVSEGDRVQLLAPIGTIQADANGRISVYIDDKPSDASQGGWYDRTWYDGLIYEERESGCLSNPLYDLTGPEGQPDCKVDFYDFAELAAHWLECNLIPESACFED